MVGSSLPRHVFAEVLYSAGTASIGSPGPRSATMASTETGSVFLLGSKVKLAYR